jgi:hypothetical protein
MFADADELKESDSLDSIKQHSPENFD